jgi:hypothetical protein
MLCTLLGVALVPNFAQSYEVNLAK